MRQNNVEDYRSAVIFYMSWRIFVLNYLAYTAHL